MRSWVFLRQLTEGEDWLCVEVTSLYRLGLVGRKLFFVTILSLLLLFLAPSSPQAFRIAWSELLSPGLPSCYNGRDLWNHEPKPDFSSLRLLLWGICHRWRGWETQKMDSEKWGCCDYLNMWLLIPWDGLVGGIWESQEKQDQKKPYDVLRGKQNKRSEKTLVGS